MYQRKYYTNKRLCGRSMTGAYLACADFVESHECERLR
jgi:hypothetical protein